jgi:hypothetical protein
MNILISWNGLIGSYYREHHDCGGAMADVGAVHDQLFVTSMVVAPVVTINLQIFCFRPIDVERC